MPWTRAKFRDQVVWAEVDEAGEPLVNQGRVRIRYSDAPTAKTYPAARRNLSFDEAAIASATADLEAAAVAPAPKRAPKKKPASTVPASKPTDGVALCFTDGACRGNPGPSGAGVYVEFPDGRRLRVSKSLGQGTNNIAELTAILLAVQHLEREGWLPQHTARILTDSSYSIGVLQTGWKAKANQELVRKVKRCLAAHPSIRLEKVAGHAGIPGNEEADRLANAGVDGLSLLEWE